MSINNGTNSLQRWHSLRAFPNILKGNKNTATSPVHWSTKAIFSFQSFHVCSRNKLEPISCIRTMRMWNKVCIGINESVQNISWIEKCIQNIKWSVNCLITVQKIEHSYIKLSFSNFHLYLSNNAGQIPFCWRNTREHRNIQKQLDTSIGYGDYANECNIIL